MKPTINNQQLKYKMKQAKLLLLLLIFSLVLSVWVSTQYNTEMSTLDINMSEIGRPGAEIGAPGAELLEVTDKEELLDANIELKESKDLEELHKCHEEYIKERNELFLSSIYDEAFGSIEGSIESEEKIEVKPSLFGEDSHIYSSDYRKERFVYMIWNKTIEILNELNNGTEKESEEKRMLGMEESSDEEMSPIDIVPETVSDRLETLLSKIEDHPELSEAEKTLAVSSILHGEICPLEFLDGYSEYKEEFFILNPTGHDPVSGLTFEESVNYYISLGKRVRDDLEQDT